MKFAFDSKFALYSSFSSSKIMAFPLLLALQENVSCLSCGFLFTWHVAIYSPRVCYPWFESGDYVYQLGHLNKVTREVGHPKMTLVVL